MQIVRIAHFPPIIYILRIFQIRIPVDGSFLRRSWCGEIDLCEAAENRKIKNGIMEGSDEGHGKHGTEGIRDLAAERSKKFEVQILVCFVVTGVLP